MGSAHDDGLWYAQLERERLSAALRQPPQPTGDVGELEAEIAKILKDQYEAMTVTLRDGTRQYFAARAAKAVMERVNSRSARSVEAGAVKVQNLMAEHLYIEEGEIMGTGPASYAIARALTGAGEEGE